MGSMCVLAMFLVCPTQVRRERLGEGRTGENHASRPDKAAQIPTASSMHMKSSWMVQKGMRTAFNQGDWRRDVLTGDVFAIIIVAMGRMDLDISGWSRKIGKVMLFVWEAVVDDDDDDDNNNDNNGFI